MLIELPNSRMKRKVEIRIFQKAKIDRASNFQDAKTELRFGFKEAHRIDTMDDDKEKNRSKIQQNDTDRLCSVRFHKN